MKMVFLSPNQEVYGGKIKESYLLFYKGEAEALRKEERRESTTLCLWYMYMSLFIKFALNIFGR